MLGQVDAASRSQNASKNTLGRHEFPFDTIMHYFFLVSLKLVTYGSIPTTAKRCPRNSK